MTERGPRQAGIEGIHRIAVEDPSSLGSRQLLKYIGHEVLPVPVDASGLDVGALRASGARAVLLTPAHQFPTGVVLDGERRRELLTWVADGGVVIEDDYDAEHRYDRPPVPALRSMLPDGVCYAGSISKLLAPALRVGWILVPSGRLDALVTAKRYADLGNSVLTQLVLARLMDSGELEQHLRHVRLRHRQRRDTMQRALQTHLPGARIHGPAASLHLVVTFGDPTGGDRGSGFRDTDLAGAALAKGVKTHSPVLAPDQPRPSRPGPRLRRKPHPPDRRGHHHHRHRVARPPLTDPDAARAETRQFNVCFTARVVGGLLTISDESTELRFVQPHEVDHLPIHHTQRLRIGHFLEHREQPYLG